MKVSFLIMTEFLKHQQIYTTIKIIEKMIAKNHEIHGIFFFGTSVISLTKNAKLGKNTRDIPNELKTLIEKKISIYACQTWADNYGLLPEHAIEGVQILGLGELSTMAAESDKLIVFGAHA